MTYPSTLAYLLIGKETTWGTAVTATKDAGLLITDTSPSIDREVMESHTISSIETQKVTSGIVDASFSVEGDYQHGRLFHFIIGPQTAVETTGDFKHTFTVADAPDSMTAEKGNKSTASTDWTSAGLLCESAELSIALNENLKLSSEWKGKTATAGTTGATAVISTLPVFPHALCEVKINTTAASEVQSASISINKVVERSGGISSNLYQQGHATELKFEFTAELGFTDDTYHELAFGGASILATGDPTGYEFEINADNGVALGSGRREIKFVLENCITKSFSEATSVGGLTFITITGVGTFKELFTVDNITGAAFI